LKSTRTAFVSSFPAGWSEDRSVSRSARKLSGRQRGAHGRALDCFTFNGGFALHLAGNCEQVLGIDIAAEAIAGAERNARLNGIATSLFRLPMCLMPCASWDQRCERFDTIVLDPPAFTKSRTTVKSGARGYKEINLARVKVTESRRRFDYLLLARIT
jgi:23S rRNA (cytosine1962-C5)-methyltransferase